MKQFLLSFILIFFFPLCVYSDCAGCYDLVQVNLKLVNGENLNGYVYEYVSDELFDVADWKNLNKNYEYSFIKGYIDINEKLNQEFFYDFDYHVIIDEDSVREIKPSSILSINEIHREVVRIRSLDKRSFDLINNKSPIDYKKIYLSDDIYSYLIVVIAYGKIHEEKVLETALGKCSNNSEETQKCIKSVNSKYDDNVFLIMQFADY